MLRQSRADSAFQPNRTIITIFLQVIHKYNDTPIICGFRHIEIVINMWAIGLSGESSRSRRPSLLVIFLWFFSTKNKVTALVFSEFA